MGAALEQWTCHAGASRAGISGGSHAATLQARLTPAHYPGRRAEEGPLSSGTRTGRRRRPEREGCSGARSAIGRGHAHPHARALGPPCLRSLPRCDDVRHAGVGLRRARVARIDRRLPRGGWKLHRHGRRLQRHDLGGDLRQGDGRAQIVLATKATMPVGSGPNDRGSSRKHLRESCDASLRRLRTDYIDLYQIHAEDLWTPLEETLTALDDLVCAGKVLYVGASNFRAYRLMKALALSDRHGWTRFVSLQPQYNLLVRTIEREHFALATEEGIGLITWSPLAAGMLTGKITRERKPPESRLAQRDM